MILTSVTRSEYHGDGIETQSSPESVLISVLRPKSARTPPSAFPFLQIQLSKSKLENTNSTSGEPPGFFETTEVRPVRPGWEPQSFENLMPCKGGEAVMLTSEAPLNNIGASESTLISKNLRIF
jgi:hypothetical protein